MRLADGRRVGPLRRSFDERTPTELVNPPPPRSDSGRESHAAMLVENVTASMSFVRSGQLRALAISSAQRHPSLPNVPSIAEAGFPNLVTEGWLSLVGPAGLPGPVRDRLADEVRKIVQQPDFQSWTVNSGGLVDPMTPDEASAYVRLEAARWSELIRAVGIRLD